jgi:hypothetical protein
MSQLRLLVAVAIAAVVVAVAPAPAHAGRQTTTDATRDVYRIPAGGTPQLQRDNRKHDIVRAGTVHRGTTVTLWLDVRRLARSGYIASFYVRTPDETWWLHYDRQSGPAYTSLFHASGPEVLDCGGLRGKALPRRERVVITVPRACIDRPRWIRFGASMGLETETAHFLDDARIDAGFFSNKCRLGPRVHRN